MADKPKTKPRDFKVLLVNLIGSLLITVSAATWGAYKYFSVTDSYRHTDQAETLQTIIRPEASINPKDPDQVDGSFEDATGMSDGKFIPLTSDTTLQAGPIQSVTAMPADSLMLFSDRQVPASYIDLPSQLTNFEEDRLPSYTIGATNKNRGVDVVHPLNDETLNDICVLTCPTEAQNLP